MVSNELEGTLANTEPAGSWGLGIKSMGKNLFQTQAHPETEDIPECFAPYWTMKAADNNGQGQLQFREGLNFNQIRFLLYLCGKLHRGFPTLATILQKNALAKVDSRKAQSVVAELFTSREIFVDIKEFAEQTNLHTDEARRQLKASIDFFQQREYHWYRRVYNPISKRTGYYPFQASILEVHHEVEPTADGTKAKVKKGGEILLTIPMEFLIAVAQYPEIFFTPKWLMTFNGRKEAAAKLSTRLVEHYYMTKGINGVSWVKLETAIKFSGIDTRIKNTRKKADGTRKTSIVKKSWDRILGEFMEAVSAIIAEGGLDEEGTYFYYDDNEKVPLEKAVTMIKKNGLPVYSCHLDFTKAIYFAFKVKGIQDYTKEKPKRTRKKISHPTGKNAGVVKAAAPKAAKPNPNGLTYEGALED